MLPKPVLVQLVEISQEVFLPLPEDDLLASIVAFGQAAKVLNKRRDL